MLKKQYSKTNASCKVTFSLPKEAAPNATEVKLLGEFNNWNIEAGTIMKAGKTEYTATLDLATGRSYEFRYLIDGAKWQNDYQADGYVPSTFGVDNSVLVLDIVPAPEKKATTTTKKATTTAKKAAPAPKKAAEPKKKAAPVKAAAPKKAKSNPKAAPVSKSADDLKRIEGIGPKIEQLLNQAGIKTFDDLAKAKKAALQQVLEAAGPRFKMHDPTTWTTQAKLAAKGDWDKLAELQDELKGGKKK
ncbi:MAG: 50S ribosomal protein L27 [Phaeodactylibacter sp.]|nr:50S ribosomal protein L27 [Phaeodactylibacter sp.]HQU59092.1 50S ribosomal protein L27 [Saprospiraceae bacterium]